MTPPQGEGEEPREEAGLVEDGDWPGRWGRVARGLRRGSLPVRNTGEMGGGPEVEPEDDWLMVGTPSERKGETSVTTWPFSKKCLR